MPKGSVPAKLGRLTLSGNKIVFKNPAEPTVTVDRKLVPSPVVLSYTEAKPDVVRYGSVLVLQHLESHLSKEHAEILSKYPSRE